MYDKDASLYKRCLKETLDRDGPGKYQEFLQVCYDFQNSRIDANTTIVRAHGIIKDHWYLILGFAFYLTIKKSATTVKWLTMADAVYYMASVREAFHDKPSKFLELLNVLFTAHRVDEGSVIAKVQKLMKGHPNLLLGLNVFLSSQPKITVSPKTEPHSYERKHVESFFSFEPKITVSPKTEPDTDERKNAESLLSSEPKVTISPKTEPKVTISPKTEPKITISPKTEPKVTISPKTEPKITIAPKTKPDSNKRKHADSNGGGFMNKRKTRSQSHEIDAAQVY